MNTVKVFIHPSKISTFNKGLPILATQMTVSQYDLELNLDLDRVSVIEQTNGVLIRKLKWYERLFKIRVRKDD